jgi:hypothetical protein
MVRLRYKIEVSVSSSSSEEKDLGNPSYTILHDSSGEGGTRKTTLAAGASDVSIMFNGVADAKFVLIKVNTVTSTDTLAGIEIKLNSTGGEVIDLVPVPDAKQAHMLLTTDGLTNLYASNPSAVAVEVVAIMVGD